MERAPRSRLTPHAEQIAEWLEVEGLTLAGARERLAKAGCVVSAGWLREWWGKEQTRRVQARILDQIASAAGHSAAIESEFSRNPAPAIETLIRLHQVLLLKLSSQAEGAPELIALVARLMKPALEWVRIEERRKDRALRERKYEEERSAGNPGDQRGPAGALKPATVEKIEQELTLF